MKFDLATQSLREMNAHLHGISNQPDSNGIPNFEVINPNGAHCIAAGLNGQMDVLVHGHVGYYCAGMNQHASVCIDGRAGPAVAENMMSGNVDVASNASQYAGASGHGGLLIIRGDASSRCGISMKGIDIVVGGSIGAFSAFMAQKGRLVVCGDAGPDLGDSIYEAQLFVRGEVHSLGSDCVEKEMRPEHLASVDELLTAAGMHCDAGDFRRYGSARKLYNFNIDNADACI